jgi:hypothetical protein
VLSNFGVFVVKGFDLELAVCVLRFVDRSLSFVIGLDFACPVKCITIFHWGAFVMSFWSFCLDFERVKRLRNL